MILNLFTSSDHLFAVSSKPAILCWNLEELATKESIPKISSPLGISIKKSQSSLQLPIESVKGVQFFTHGDGVLLIYNSQQILVIDGASFKNYKGFQLKLKTIFSKKLSQMSFNDSQNNQTAKSLIQAVQLVKTQMQQNLIVSLNDGRILQFCLESQTVTSQIFLNSLFTPIRQGQDLCLSTKNKQKQFGTSMIKDNQNSRLIIGTNFGRIFTISTSTNFKLCNQYLFKDGTKTSQEMNIQSVKSLYKLQSRLFSIHSSYVIQYNTKLSECIGIYQFRISSMILHSLAQYQKQSLVLVGQFPKLQIISQIFQNAKQNRIQLQISNRIGTIVQNFGKMIVVGGSEGNIDIFWHQMHLMILLS